MSNIQIMSLQNTKNQTPLPKQYKIKIVMLGDSGVGKSNIVSRFTRQQFTIQTKTTVGVEFAIREVEANIQAKPSKLILQVWDTAGQQRFQSISSAYFKNALGAIIVYDITNKASFQHLQHWYNQILENSNEFISVMILGNKSDLEFLREVAFKEDGLKWASKHNSIFCETSTLTNTNIEEAMVCLIEQIVQKMNTNDINKRKNMARYSEINRNSQLEKENGKQHRGCC